MPNPPYAGTHGDLPLGDPWWKIFAAIVAAIAAIVGVILAATSGGTAFVGVKGGFDETGTADPAVSCCKPDWKTVAKETGLDKGKVTGAAVASAIATGALAVALSDREDPWWRGQEATPPDRGELTLAESLAVKLDYLDLPNAGVPYRMGTNWTYKRQTTRRVLEHSVEEVQENIHLAEGVEVDAPSPINAFSQALTVRTRFLKPGGQPYRGVELFAFALVISPEAEFGAILPLLDDGIDPDEDAEDGRYTGAIHLEPIFPIMRQRNFRFEGR